MLNRNKCAYRAIGNAINAIKRNNILDKLLKEKNADLHQYIHTANKETFSTISFKKPTWRSNPELRELSRLLGIIKDGIKTVQTRSHLSITPKVEDIVLVNRWIQIYNVPHYYLQVFFDCAFVISFEDILRICSDGKREGNDFSIESDVKNQGKTTIKVNIDSADLIIDDIEMPEHFSQVKELDRGRLLFYVKFKDSRGEINVSTFNKVLGL